MDNKDKAAPVLIPCPDYDAETVRRALGAALAAVGGLDWVRPGMRVGVKLNLCAAKKPEAAATTHPVLAAELTRMLRARGASDLLIVPGNYGRDFACGQLELNMDEAVSCSNYFGATLDAACVLGFERLLIVGHIGKMAKVAGGIMNTHSRVADCRVEVLAAHAALVGASQQVVEQIMAAATTDAALDALQECGLDGAAMASLMHNLADKLNHRVAGRLQVEAIVFSNVHGVLGETPGAEQLARVWLGNPS